MAHEISELIDNNSEATVVATVLIHPEFLEYSSYLKGNSFSDKANGCLYWAINQLYDSGITTMDAINLLGIINSNSAVEKTMQKYNLLDIEQLQEHIDLAKETARDTLEEYRAACNRVLELAFKRDLSRELKSLSSHNCFSDCTLDELNNQVYSSLEKLTQKYITGEGIKQFSEVTKGLWEEIERRRTKDGTYGIKSKFPAINEYFTFEPTELVLVSGRMKRGKSAYMMNEAIHKLQLNIPTLYIDTEMSDRLFYERMLANVSGVTVKQIKMGRYNDEEAQKILKAREWIDSKPFIHLYDPQMSMEQLYTICRGQKHRMNLQFVVYDYIKSDVISSSEQYNELGNKCDFLKNSIAGDLELAVLAGAQLNRQNQLADSDKLERYASVSMKWADKSAEEYIADGEECGNFKLSIKLNRLGEQMLDGDYIDMAFDGNRMRIEQAKQHTRAGDVPFFE